jgi:hypothetical protein
MFRKMADGTLHSSVEGEKEKRGAGYPEIEIPR